jgi:hypothetical protein
MKHQSSRTSGSDVSRRRMLAQTASMIALACAVSPRPALALSGEQNNWRFCSRCFTMFYNGALGEAGACPAGGSHLAQGMLFTMHYEDAPRDPASYQYSWRYCEKCRAMFFDGGPSKGHCPAGGGHVSQGLNFGLDLRSPAPAHSQPGWRFCEKCFVLFYNDGTTKGVCAARGAHVAQGFLFNAVYESALADPGPAVSNALQSVVGSNRPLIEKFLKSELGQADLLKPGYTLYDLNLRLGQPKFQSVGTSFDYQLPGNYLYLKSTTPTVLGSYGDPAFEIHFGLSLVGTILANGLKPRVQGVVASVPSITVKPRNVSGGIVTTFAYFFQKTEAGGKAIQRAVDTYLRDDLTEKINAILQLA